MNDKVLSTSEDEDQSSFAQVDYYNLAMLRDVDTKDERSFNGNDIVEYSLVGFRVEI